MLGYIVKILDKPKWMSIQYIRPHSIGDYGIVVDTTRLSVQVKTAHDTMQWYLKWEVEVYSRTPVDLIITGGKSIPANKSAVDKSISQSSSGFRNSSELHNTYVFVKNKDEWDRAREFYKERWFSVNYEYSKTFRYLRTYSISDDAGTHTWSWSWSLDGCKDITAQVLGVTGVTATVEFLREYNAVFLDSNSISMTETQSLEQLKFNKYVEENKDDIVELSETIDNSLESLNEMWQIFWDFYVKVKTTSAAMSAAFQNCNKIRLDEMFFDLKAYDDLLSSKEYKEAALAIKAFSKKIEALNAK